MNAQIEFLVLLHDGCIQRGKQYMILPSKLFQGAYKKAMIFTGIAPDNGHTCIGSCPVGTNNFPAEGILEVDQFALVKLYISHSVIMYSLIS
jgi:hypothetical protein